MVQKSDPNITVLQGLYARVPVRVKSETPGFSPDFSDTWASMKLTADIHSHGDPHHVDGNKLLLMIGGQNPRQYEPRSVLGVLVGRLEERFGPIKVQVICTEDDGHNPLDRGELSYRLQLHPIPDNMNAARFGGAVRQTLRAISNELEQECGRGRR